MAFLDNSGDIILDAVLTETGRKRMSSGRFRISKFAFGDDEINYAQFDKNHPSGSAYYDLEVLQTPVFEAVTQINANINYGLMSYTNPNLLYMPILKRNEIDNGIGMALTHNSKYYIAVNQETLNAMEGTGGAFSTAHQKLIMSNSTNYRAIAYEFGIDSPEISKNSINKNQFLVSTGLDGANFTAEVNQLFISQVHGYGSSTPAYANNLTTNSLTSNPSVNNLAIRAYSSPSKNRANYIAYESCKGGPVTIYDPTGGSTTAGTHSVISGPSSRLVQINFTVAPGLDHQVGGTRDRKYTEYGKIGQTGTQAFGGGDTTGYTYDYIDTSVYLSHDKTGATISVPVRIIRRAS